jgi:hypothetical protein
MTVAQLKKAMKAHNYIIVRYFDGHTRAINSRVAGIAKAKGDAEETNIVSFRPCCFQHYISEKAPFL